MFDTIVYLFSHAFVQRALVIGILVSLCAALLGVILVLKRYSLIGHGLADVGFASLSIALILGLPPLVFSVPVMILTSFVIMYISQNKKISGDVAIGIFATGALSVGVIVTSLSKGFNVDVYNYMFGSILAVNKSDLWISIVLSVIVLLSFVLFYNRIFLITVDEKFAVASGINVTVYQFLISILTSLTVVIGMRMMGTLLISSLIIFPAVIARKFSKGFKSLVVISAIISVFCFMVGMCASFLLNTPIGATVVCTNIVLLLLISAINGLKVLLCR